jgi:hypothetical protein
MGKFSRVLALYLCLGLLLIRPAFAAPDSLQKVTVTVVDTRIDVDTVTFSTGTATDQLSSLRKSKLGCLYTSGINKNSFESCYGQKYATLNKSYVDFFSSYKDKLILSLKADLNDVCPQYTKPCDDLIDYAEGRILTDPNIWEDLSSEADEKKNYMGVDSEALDKVLAKFKVRYTVYLNIRISTAKAIVDTVNAIQSYIQASKLPTDFDYQDFEPTEAYQALGMGDINSDNGGGAMMTTDADQIATQSAFFAGSMHEVETAEDRKRKLSKQVRQLVQPLAKKQLKDRSLDSNNFLKKLVAEAKDQQVLNYFLANAMVDSDSLDLSQLPSVTLDQIKKNRLKLNTNRV